MSKEEKTIVSAINAMAKATKALDKLTESPGSGFMSVRIEPLWARHLNYSDCGAEFHVSRDKLFHLAELFGKEVKESDQEYDSETEVSKYHFYGFEQDGVWIFAIEDRSVTKGEN